MSSTACAVSVRFMPAVGSSSRITSAPPAMVMPISSARCSAYESTPAGVSRRRASPIDSMISSPRVRASARAFSRCQNE